MSDDRDKTIHQKTSDPFFNIIFLISVAEFHKHISGTCKGKPPPLLKAFHHIHAGMEFTAQIKPHAFIANIHGCSAQLHKLSCHNVHMRLKHIIPEMWCQDHMTYALLILLIEHPE